jgi:hypothetical protein
MNHVTSLVALAFVTAAADAQTNQQGAPTAMTSTRVQFSPAVGTQPAWPSYVDSPAAQRATCP